MSELKRPVPDRRASDRTDRRKHSRSGRRASDPRVVKWLRIAWLFAAYGVYLSVRSLPASVKRIFARDKNRAAT